MSVKIVRLARGALAIATAVLILLGGCGRPDPSPVSELPTAMPTTRPTDTPTATATGRPTATTKPVPTPHLSRVSPNSAKAGERNVTLYLRGEGFQETPHVFLAHPTQGEIEATDVMVYPGGRKARCVFDISEAEPGVWSVQVINLDGTQSELDDAFEIIAPTPTTTPTPSPTPTATIVIVRATSTPSPTPTAMPTAKPRRKTATATPPPMPSPETQP